jgi:hypothetical protein
LFIWIGGGLCARAVLFRVFVLLIHFRDTPKLVFGDSVPRRNGEYAAFPGWIYFQIWVYGGAPKGNFLKEVSLWTPFKNFQKTIFNNVF